MSAPLPAQFGDTESGAPALKGFIDPGLFGAPEDEGTDEKEFTIDGFVVPQQENSPALLAVRVKLAPQWHVYSLTQQEGPALPTKIKLDKSEQYRLLGTFTPNKKPVAGKRSEDWPDVPMEEHYDEVKWVAPIELQAGIDPLSVAIHGELDGQVCKDKVGCIPFSFHDTTFTARVGSAEQIASVSVATTNTAKPQAVGEFVSPKGNPIIRGYIRPQVVVPGQTAQLVLTVEPQPNWHVYVRADEVPEGAPYRPTLIALTNTSGLTPKMPVADAPIVKKDEVVYHEGPTTWTIDFPIPANTRPGEFPIGGQLGYQVCTDGTCLPPRAVQFNGTIHVAESGVAGSTAVSFAESGYGIAQRALEASPVAVAPTGAAKPTLRLDAASVKPTETVEATSLLVALLFALGGGLILNVMPCVLPVIGLKVLSFFEQAGHNRGRAFFLNFSYALGMMSVFLVLAFLGVGLSQMFTERWFGIIMSSVVFVMALSLMGLWELQIPSFIGAGGMQKVAEKEGGVGAFFKGILTTLLAIPCGAPLLSPALKFVGDQVQTGHAFYAYPIFLTIGLGMALPYLIVGAFPELLRFMPKPGAWMETFKKSMGFLMLGAVVWILWFLPIQDILPTVAFLFGLWVACWIIGRVPLTASAGQSMQAWGVAVAVVLVTGAVSVYLLHPAMKAKLGRVVTASVLEGERDEDIVQRVVALQGDKTTKSPLSGLLSGTPISDSANEHDGGNAAVGSHLLWRPFTRSSFDRLVAEEKTILVDFTADWCFTCKVLERTVLNTEAVSNVVIKNDVVTMQADWTSGAPEVTAMLDLLGARQVPVIAIFPAGDPNHPIIFRGGYTQSGIVEALQKAGPSIQVAQGEHNRTAMNDLP